jgi:hypothetical protein
MVSGTVTYGERDYPISFDDTTTLEYFKKNILPKLTDKDANTVVNFLSDLQTLSSKRPLTSEKIDEAYQKYFPTKSDKLDLTPRLSDEQFKLTREGLEVGKLTREGLEVGDLPQPSGIKEPGSVGTFSMGVGGAGGSEEEQQKNLYKITITYYRSDESGNKVKVTKTFELNCDKDTGEYAKEKASQLPPEDASEFLSALAASKRPLTKADVDTVYKSFSPYKTAQKEKPKIPVA